MDKNNISGIIKRFLSGRYPERTEERVQKWIIKDKNAKEKEQASLEYWNELKVKADAETSSALKRVNKRIKYSKSGRKISLFPQIYRVAAILIPLFIIAGGYLYYNSTQKELIEVSVAYGDTKHIFLPDSSEIWLNAGTSIKYPKAFKGNERHVRLDGEAYFSVKKDNTKPFIVQAEKLSVKVLGTKFNVKAYAKDEKAVATLTTGKVEVSVDTNDVWILKPNQQLTYNITTSLIDVTEVSPTETDSWLNGQLIFTNSSLNEIIETLERRFNVSIENQTKVPASKLYTVKFLKNEKIEEILNILKEVVGFNSHQQENKIVLTEK